MTGYEYCLNYNDGSKYHYEFGKLSNIEGPAAIDKGRIEYWADGVKYESLQKLEKSNADLNILQKRILNELNKK